MLLENPMSQEMGMMQKDGGVGVGDYENVSFLKIPVKIFYK